MIPLTSARIDVTKVGSENPDFTIPDEHIRSVNYDRKISELLDTGDITLNNDHDEYTGRIVSGDRLDFYVEYGVNFLPAWGEGNWGEQKWGGQRLMWTSIVRNVENTYEILGSGTISLECEDFTLSVLNMRNVYNLFEDADVRTVIDSIISDYTTEISVFYERDINETVSISFNGDSAYDALNEVLSRANLVAYEQGDMIIIRNYFEKEPRFTVEGRDTGLITIMYDDEGVKNYVRVDGATSNGLDNDALQETVDDTTVVTEEDRLYFRTQTRKSEISEIELYTRRTSEDDITVRLQKDDNGPIAIDDESSDIASITQDYRFISLDNWTTFQIPGHTLPEPRPWVIIETDNENGHEIGINSNGIPAHRIYFPYDITTVDYSVESMRTHRRRDHKEQADGAESTRSAREISSDVLDHYSQPKEEIEIECESLRMHNLKPGDVVEFDGDNWIVTDRSDEYENINMQSNLTLREVSTV